MKTKTTKTGSLKTKTLKMDWGQELDMDDECDFCPRYLDGRCNGLTTGQFDKCPKAKSDSRRRPCLVNVLTGEKTYGEPGMSEELLFGLMANGMLE